MGLQSEKGCIKIKCLAYFLIGALCGPPQSANHAHPLASGMLGNLSALLLPSIVNHLE